MFAIFGSALRRRPAPRSIIEAGSAPAYLSVGVSAALVLILFAQLGLRIAGAEFDLVAVLTASSLLVAYLLRARGFRRIATALESWALLTGSAALFTLLTFAAAACSMAYADPVLAEADRWLAPGFDWPEVVRALHRHRELMFWLHAAYASVQWQPAVLLLALAATERPERSWTFLSAWMITLFMVIALFSVAPALGAYPYFHIGAGDLPHVWDVTPWVQPRLLNALRSGSLQGIRFIDLAGIIAFPSFHAGAAVLLAWAFWPIRLLRTPFALLNAVMLASAVPIGGHYLIDILAGVAVASAGIAIAVRIEHIRAGLVGSQAPRRSTS